MVLLLLDLDSYLDLLNVGLVCQPVLLSTVKKKSVNEVDDPPSLWLPSPNHFENECLQRRQNP